MGPLLLMLNKEEVLIENIIYRHSSRQNHERKLAVSDRYILLRVLARLRHIMHKRAGRSALVAQPPSSELRKNPSATLVVFAV